MASDAAYLHAWGMTSALGVGLDDHARGLEAAPALTQSDRYSPGLSVALGQVQAALPDDSLWPASMRSRNNRLLWSAWQQLAPAWQACGAGVNPARVAVIVGTSTSGIGESETHFSSGSKTKPDYALQEMLAPARFLAQQLGITGPIYTLSTACSSGAKALAAGRRLLNAGLVDWVIAGGADALCGMTVRGFHALEALSAAPSNPLSVNRAGINIGEAAALFLLSRKPASIALCGVGESSDAHHISAPDPEGMGAERAMHAALEDAGITPTALAYVNLHGTGTTLNDKMEAKAVARLLGQVPVSSTKPFTGHTLGAAGALEAGICALALRDRKLVVHHWDGCRDPELPDLALVEQPQRWPQDKRYVMSNSFAFGGNNISLILARHEHD